MDIKLKYWLRLSAFLCVSFFHPSTAYALWCSNGSQTVQYTAVGSITAAVVPFTINKNILDSVVSDMSTYAYCNGSTMSAWQDALQATALTISPKLSQLGYVGYLNNGSDFVAPLPPTVCLWPDNQCSVLGLPNDTTLPLNVKIGIRRTADSGDWHHSGVAISAGEVIATLSTRYRYQGNAYSNSFNWYFIAQNDIVIPAYTCSITQYDGTVTLPSVSRADIMSHGTGRYPNTKKEFKFNLACDPQTRVYMTFEGDRLTGTGTDEVLENKLAGNPNVGIQLLYDDITPVKLSDKFQVATSAQATETLSFHAYYYTKNTAINGGPVKANATFTFDYQ